LKGGVHGVPEKDKEPDRRRVSRSRMSAAVELLDSEERPTSARILDLNILGCRVYVGYTLPKGTKVKVRITHNQEVFEAVGEVIWSGTNATGIAFKEYSAEHEEILDKWLQ
jgi:hypothetical protein